MPKRRRGYRGGINASFSPYAPMVIDTGSRVNPRRASAPTPPVSAQRRERSTLGAAPTFEQAVVLPNTGVLLTEQGSPDKAARSPHSLPEGWRRASAPIAPATVLHYEPSTIGANPTLEQALVIPKGEDTKRDALMVKGGTEGFNSTEVKPPSRTSYDGGTYVSAMLLLSFDFFVS